MRRLAVLAIPAALFAGQARFARLGEFEGKVEVQADAASDWAPALRNMALGDSAWIRTATGAHVEIELDEGSILRLAGDSLAEISDYTRLSTGQRVTLLSLDHGVAYFTGESQPRDSLVLAVPGAQAAIRKGARLRLDAGPNASQICVIEGTIRFSSPTAELDIQEGRTVRVEPSQTARFFLFNEVAAMASDAWSEERDKALATTSSAAHTPGLRAGLADLDSAGAWIDTAASGAVWKPKVAAGWAPFRNGKWIWSDALGFNWVSSDTWGWLPYHYGRWLLDENSGWVWVPGKDTAFSPGDVYWLRGNGLVGWGPLAPGEQWTPPARPRQYLSAHTTFAAFKTEARELDPAGFAAPKQPSLAYVAAPPSPALSAARLEAQRPVLQAGSTRVVPHLDGVTFDNRESAADYNPPPPPPPPAARPPQPAPYQPPPSPVIVAVPPQEPPTEVYYPVPVPTGIVVINPPDRRDRDHHHHNHQPPPPSKPATPPPPPPPPPAAAPPPPRTLPVTIPRNETVRPSERPEPRHESKEPPAHRSAPEQKPEAPSRARQQ